MCVGMIHQSTADDKAAVWVRFRRMVLWAGAGGAALALGVLLYFRAAGTPMPWQARLAIGLGVTLTGLVGGALMALVFASARSGHDSEVDAAGHES